MSAVAVDEATGDVLRRGGANGTSSSEFNAAGEWVGWITALPTGPLGEPRRRGGRARRGGLRRGCRAAARSTSSGRVSLVPDVTTGAASKLTRTTALLNGVVNGDGKAGAIPLRMGHERSLRLEHADRERAAMAKKRSSADARANCTPARRTTSGSSAKTKTAPTTAPTREFTTLPAVEALSTGPVQDLTPTSATLTGSLTPNGHRRALLLRMGHERRRTGNTSPAPPGPTPAPAANRSRRRPTLAGLAPNTTYHYRLVGDQQLRHDGRRRRDVHDLRAAADHERTDHRHRPRSGDDQREGRPRRARHRIPLRIRRKHRVRHRSAARRREASPAGEAPVAVSAALSGLKLGVTYHFRVVASNAAGTTVGAGPDVHDDPAGARSTASPSPK